MKEAPRYLQNAKDTLGKTPIEDNYYTDIKPVKDCLKATREFISKFK